MAAKFVIYHNSRCSKSRRTLALLRDNGVEPEIIEYLKDPPSANRVGELIGMLGVEPHALLRTREAQYKKAGLSKTSNKTEIARAIARDPILMERPVVVRGRKAVLGRPPEGVLDLL